MLTLQDAIILSAIYLRHHIIGRFFPALMASRMEPVAALRGGDKK